MAKNRYENMEQHRAFSGRLRVLESINRKLYRVEIWALNDKVNRNNWRYINLKEHLNEFKDIPILTAYLRDGEVIGDGHNYNMRRDPKTGEEYPSFTGADAERIVGWVPKDADIRIEKDLDGKTSWVVVTGYLWTWYSRELVEKIARQGSGMEVSIETLVTREHKEGDVDVEEEYIVLGITVLGNGVTPAVAGANIQTLAKLRSSMEKEILKAASYAKKPQEESKINSREGVKEMPLTKQQLKNLEKNFNGYKCVGANADKTRVALLSANGQPFGYAYAETDKGTVISERIKEASAKVIFSFDGNEVEADFDAIIGENNEKMNLLSADNEKLSGERNKLQSELDSMKAKERTRRVQAAKDAVKAELARRNENRSEERRFSEEICNDLLSRIESNEFTDMEDKDGNWIGEKAVCSAVSALCMDEQTRMDMEARSKEKRYIEWSRENAKNSANNLSTIGEKLRAEGASLLAE